MPPMSSFPVSSINPAPTTVVSMTGPSSPSGAAAVVGNKRSIEETTSSVSESPKRHAKSRGSICHHVGCIKLAKLGGLCISHGGGRRCKSDGCKSSDQGGGFCKKHGGGKRCKFSGCVKSDVGFGRCTLHGGGHRCEFVGENGERCGKSDQGGGSLDGVHQRRCKTHGGGRKCKHVSGCMRSDAGRGLCRQHGGGRRRSKPASTGIAQSTSCAAAAAAPAPLATSLFNLSAGLTSGLMMSSLLSPLGSPTNKSAKEQRSQYSLPQRHTSFTPNFSLASTPSLLSGVLPFQPSATLKFDLNQVASPLWRQISPYCLEEPPASMTRSDPATNLLRELAQQQKLSPMPYIQTMLPSSFNNRDMNLEHANAVMFRRQSQEIELLQSQLRSMEGNARQHLNAVKPEQARINFNRFC